MEGVWDGEGFQMYWLPIVERISPGDIMYSMVSILSNNVLYIWKFLK